MKTFPVSISAVLTTLTMVVLSGCSGSDDAAPATDPTQTAAQTEAEEHGHEHGPEGHAGHGAGPHDGTLADWGGGAYHVEFTVDHDKQETVVYVLGSDEKSPSPVKAESILLSITSPAFQVELAPSPLEGEADGLCSRFVGTHEKLGMVQEFAGTISSAVDGTPYVAEFSEEAHGAGGHSHSHGEDDALVWEGEPVDLAGLQIKLGHHGKELHAGKEVEPAVSITRDGKPVSDAKVFNALASADGKTILAKEVPTIYEPTTDEEPAHYAQGALAIPKEVSKVIIRFRIVPAGGEPATFDVPVSVK